MRLAEKRRVEKNIRNGANYIQAGNEEDKGEFCAFLGFAQQD